MQKTNNNVRFVTNTSAKEVVNPSYKGILNTEPSLTIEGMSEPMSVILERFQRGQTVHGTTVYYDSDVNSDLNSFEPLKESDFDLSDLDQAKKVIEEISGEINQKKQKELEQKKIDEAKKLLDDHKKDSKQLVLPTDNQSVKAEQLVLPTDNQSVKAE